MKLKNNWRLFSFTIWFNVTLLAIGVYLKNESLIAISTGNLMLREKTQRGK
jgi:hypothetical protein